MATPTTHSTPLFSSRDLTSGLVVFLVALPLCLGVALASRASAEVIPEHLNIPLIAGLISGIVGGILVGLLSGSHTSVSGPAAGLTAVVAAQIGVLGSFQTFLFALIIAGVIQLVLAFARAGFIAAFFPTSVIKGLLAAIGIILILKQIPHLVGHDPDPEGEMSFLQPDHENTFSELAQTISDMHAGAALIGIVSLLLLIVWDRWKALKKLPIPSQLIVVLLGVVMSLVIRRFGDYWAIDGNHLVNVPVSNSPAEFFSFLVFPDFSQWKNSAVYVAGFTLAAVASLETLLNIEAVDKIDPRRRNSPTNRELFAQGTGNIVCGLIGGLPVTSVIVRSSVNINSGGRTKFSAIWHGILLLLSVMFLASWLNLIPISCLAAILLVTGVKLASPALFKQMWAGGRSQFMPFIVTVTAIVFTDLLIGVVIGLVVSTAFILWSNVRRPVRQIVEKHLGGEVIHIMLANQVSFLNRAALARTLDNIPPGGSVLLDARDTDYIDPDVLDLIRDFNDKTGPARDINVSLLGFRSKYHLSDQIQFVDYSTRELQSAVTPEQVLEILKLGNERFRTGQRLTRDLGRAVVGTASGQHPLAVVLSCIDSRSPAEIIFDLGVGDIFSARVAGNVVSRKMLGSIEYGCAVAGAKLILVLGHTRCGAVTAAVDLICSGKNAADATGCQHLDFIVNDIQKSTDVLACRAVSDMSDTQKETMIDGVARKNVLHMVERLRQESQTIDRLIREDRVAVVGALYDVVTGEIELLTDLQSRPIPTLITTA